MGTGGSDLDSRSRCRVPCLRPLQRIFWFYKEQQQGLEGQSCSVLLSSAPAEAGNWRWGSGASQASLACSRRAISPARCHVLLEGSSLWTDGLETHPTAD